MRAPHSGHLADWVAPPHYEKVISFLVLWEQMKGYRLP